MGLKDVVFDGKYLLIEINTAFLNARWRENLNSLIKR